VVLVVVSAHAVTALVYSSPVLSAQQQSLVIVLLLQQRAVQASLQRSCASSNACNDILIITLTVFCSVSCSLFALTDPQVSDLQDCQEASDEHQASQGLECALHTAAGYSKQQICALFIEPRMDSICRGRHCCCAARWLLVHKHTHKQTNTQHWCIYTPPLLVERLHQFA
jgi:hypothetical protein